METLFVVCHLWVVLFEAQLVMDAKAYPNLKMILADANSIRDLIYPSGSFGALNGIDALARNLYSLDRCAGVWNRCLKDKLLALETEVVGAWCVWLKRNNCCTCFFGYD